VFREKKKTIDFGSVYSIHNAAFLSCFFFLRKREKEKGSEQNFVGGMLSKKKKNLFS
jgi:hypothetical protein